MISYYLEIFCSCFPSLSLLNLYLLSLYISQVTSLSKVTVDLGLERQVLVEEQDDETYSGLAVYQIFGDYSLLPSQVC